MSEEADARREMLAYFEGRLAMFGARKARLEAALALESDPDRRPVLASEIFIITRRMAELKIEIANGRSVARE